MADFLRNAVFDLISVSLRSTNYHMHTLTAIPQNARLQTPTQMVFITRTVHSTFEHN